VRNEALKRRNVVVNEHRGPDCAAECTERECHYLRELETGLIAAVSCYGICTGRCAGRLEGDDGELEPPATPPGGKPDRRSRVTVRTRELFFEATGKNDAGLDTYEVSCAAGCIVGHTAEETNGPGDCYGSCLGICHGVASVHELTVPAMHEREG
jgi:hypothetical protein